MFTKASSLTLTGEIMGSDSRVFLDSQIIQNPELSDKANKFIRFFIPFVGVAWIIIGIVNLWYDENQILNILQIVIGAVLLLICIAQPIFHKKMGRLFIRFSTNNL